MSAGGIFRSGMRAYFIPLVAGAVLASSAFLPWIIVGGVKMSGAGRELGLHGIDNYLELKQVYVHLSEDPIGWY